MTVSTVLVSAVSWLCSGQQCRILNLCHLDSPSSLVGQTVSPPVYIWVRMLRPCARRSWVIIIEGRRAKDGLLQNHRNRRNWQAWSSCKCQVFFGRFIGTASSHAHHRPVGSGIVITPTYLLSHRRGKWFDSVHAGFNFGVRIKCWMTGSRGVAKNQSWRQWLWVGRGNDEVPSYKLL